MPSQFLMEFAKAIVHEHMRHTAHGVQLVRQHMRGVSIHGARPGKAARHIARAIRLGLPVRVRNLGSALRLGRLMQAASGEVHALKPHGKEWVVQRHGDGPQTRGLYVDHEGGHNMLPNGRGEMERWPLGHVKASEIRLALSHAPPMKNLHWLTKMIDEHLASGGRRRGQPRVLGRIPDDVLPQVQASYDRLIHQSRVFLGLLPKPDGSYNERKRPRSADPKWIEDLSKNPVLDPEILLDHAAVAHFMRPGKDMGRKSSPDYELAINLHSLIGSAQNDPPHEANLEESAAAFLVVEGPRGQKAKMVLFPNLEKGKHQGPTTLKTLLKR